MVIVVIYVIYIQFFHFHTILLPSYKRNYLLNNFLSICRHALTCRHDFCCLETKSVYLNK